MNTDEYVSKKRYDDLGISLVIITFCLLLLGGLGIGLAYTVGRDKGITSGISYADSYREITGENITIFTRDPYTGNMARKNKYTNSAIQTSQFWVSIEQQYQSEDDNLGEEE